MFKVKVRFKDLQDNNHLYQVGDTYPRKGYKPTDKRINELSSNNNLRKQALIEEIKEEVEELEEVQVEEVVEEKPKKKKK